MVFVFVFVCRVFLVPHACCCIGVLLLKMMVQLEAKNNMSVECLPAWSLVTVDW